MKIDVPAFTGGVTGDVAGTATPGEPTKRGVHRLVDLSNLQGETWKNMDKCVKKPNSLTIWRNSFTNLKEGYQV